MPDVFVENNSVQTSPQEPAVLKPGVGEVSQPQPPVSGAQIKNPVHLFSSFCQNPDGVTFQNQEPGEKILLFIRRDFITNLPWIIMGIFLIIIPVFLFIGFHAINISIPFLPLRFYMLFLLFYYSLVGAFWYISFINWYFNISLITNMRVVDVDFASLVYKNVAATKLDLVQDVSYTQAGVIRTFFDYGDVLIQTAGTIDNFVFDSAPQPENVVHVVEDLIGKK